MIEGMSKDFGCVIIYHDLNLSFYLSRLNFMNWSPVVLGFFYQSIWMWKFVVVWITLIYCIYYIIYFQGKGIFSLATWRTYTHHGCVVFCSHHAPSFHHHTSMKLLHMRPMGRLFNLILRNILKRWEVPFFPRSHKNCPIKTLLRYVMVAPIVWMRLLIVLTLDGKSPLSLLRPCINLWMIFIWFHFCPALKKKPLFP